jgi:hypothetical protein
MSEEKPQQSAEEPEPGEPKAKPAPEEPEPGEPKAKPAPEEPEPGEPKAKPAPEKTSDYYRISEKLPVRFNNPGWFHGYG